MVDWPPNTPTAMRAALISPVPDEKAMQQWADVCKLTMIDVPIHLLDRHSLLRDKYRRIVALIKSSFRKGSKEDEDQPIFIVSQCALEPRENPLDRSPLKDAQGKDCRYTLVRGGQRVEALKQFMKKQNNKLDGNWRAVVFRQEFFTNINAAHVQRFMDLDNLPFEHQLPRFPAPALVAIRHCLEILSVEHENPSRKTPALHGIEKALNSVRFFTGPPFKVHTALRWKIGLRYAMIDKGLVEAICRLFRTESAMTDPQWDRYLPAFVEQLGSLSVGCETAMEMVLQEMCAAQDNFNSAHTPGVLNFAGLLSNPTKNRILQAAFRTGDWEPALQAVLAMRDHFPTGELLCLPNVFMADPNPDRARGWLVGRISLIKPLFRAFLFVLVVPDGIYQNTDPGNRLCLPAELPEHMQGTPRYVVEAWIKDNAITADMPWPECSPQELFQHIIFEMVQDPLSLQVADKIWEELTKISHEMFEKLGEPRRHREVDTAKKLVRVRRQDWSLEQLEKFAEVASSKIISLPYHKRC